MRMRARVKFKYERTDSTMRLQSVEVTSISEETYEAAVTLWPHIVIQPSVVTQPPDERSR